MKGLFLVLIFIGTFAFTQTREVSYTTFGDQSSIYYNWNQDSAGCTYISSASGIARFDGKNFYPLPTTGKGKAISASEFDATGRLWCNSFFGDIYYLKENELIRHSISEKLNGITTLETINDQLFLHTEQIIYRYQPTVNEFNQLVEFDFLRTLFSFDDTSYALGLKNGEGLLINLVTLEEKIITNQLVKSGRCRWVHNESTGLLFFEDARSIISVKHFMEEKFSATKKVEHENKVNHITLVNNLLAIAGDDGIHLYNEKGKLHEHILSKTQITHFGYSKEGGLLATSKNKGIVSIPSLSTFTYSYENILENTQIFRTINTDSLLIHGTNNGTILIHNFIANTLKKIKLPSNSEVLSMAVDEHRNNLIAYSEELFEIDLNSFEIIRHSALSSIKKITILPEEVLLGSRKGIIHYKNGQFKEGEAIGWVLDAHYIASSNEVLITTKKGIFKYNLTTEKTTAISHPFKRANIQSICRIKDCTYLIHNYKNILKTNADSNDLEIFFNQHEIISTYACNNQLMVVLPNSVVALNESGIQMQQYTPHNGLKSTKIKNINAFQNCIVFTHPKGITLYQSPPKKNSTLPTIALELQDNSTFKKKGERYTSSYKDNVFSGKFKIGNGIHSQGNISIYYKLTTIDQYWKRIENPYGEIRIERIPSGEGEIHFMAKNEDFLSSVPLIISYVVYPPFYISTWFIILVITLFLLLTIFVLRWQIQKTKQKTQTKLKQQALENRALQAELTAIRSQMNPHFIFNVLTAIQAKVIEGKTNEAYQNIGDFADLIRNILEKSGKEFISLSEEIQLMKTYIELENSRLSTPCKFTINISDLDYFESIQIPTLITQPLIENAIKHAFKATQTNKEIKLDAAVLRSGFIIKVSDNGGGFKTTHNNTEKRYESFALSALKKRISFLSKKAPYTINAEIKSSDQGTSVTFTFKYFST